MADLSPQPSDTSYLPEFHLQTLAEDKKYRTEILECHPTIFFRPDDRTPPSYPGYWRADAQGISYIRFIVRYGSHAERKPPLFLDEGVPVRIISRQAKKAGAITQDECVQAYAGLSTPAAVIAWLNEKYPNHSLTLDSLVTVYAVEYVGEV